MEARNMDTIIGKYLEQMKVGRKQSYKNLAMYPLLSTYNVGLEYLLLDEALSQNLIEIVEKDTDGSVPELKVMADWCHFHDKQNNLKSGA
jgi:hypothetical protein